MRYAIVKYNTTENNYPIYTKPHQTKLHYITQQPHNNKTSTSSHPPPPHPHLVFQKFDSFHIVLIPLQQRFQMCHIQPQPLILSLQLCNNPVHAATLSTYNAHSTVPHVCQQLPTFQAVHAYGMYQRHKAKQQWVQGCTLLLSGDTE